jgi:histidinol-phosphate aminotransferase
LLLTLPATINTPLFGAFMTPAPRPGILDISPYVGGRSAAPGKGAEIWKLSANESPFGPGPAALEAMKTITDDAGIYPEGSAAILREAIGEELGLDPARIICGGEGSGPLLSMLAAAYLTPGDEVIFSRHAFLLYEIATRANSATPVIVPERVTNRAIKVDVDAMLAAVTPRTRLVYIANPNNPTGTYISDAEMRRLHAGLPEDVLLVIDAAYSEYVDAEDYEDGTALVAAFDNVVMTRTFSKIHGLAGLRIGWAYAPAAVIEILNRIRGPFNVGSLQARVGAAAIRDRAHVARAQAHNRQWRAWLTDEIRKTGLRVDDSVANFVLIHFPEGASDAKTADAFLMSRGLILRAIGSYGLPNALRLTVGPAEANQLVVAALQEFMGQ